MSGIYTVYILYIYIYSCVIHISKNLHKFMSCNFLDVQLEIQVKQWGRPENVDEADQPGKAQLDDGMMGLQIPARWRGPLLGGWAPRYRKWLGSPPFVSHETAIWKGNNPTWGGLTITMVINHLLTEMILKVLITLLETNSLPPENRPGPKRKLVFQPSFFWCKPLISGRVAISGY